MAAALIETIRQGQARLLDQQLVELSVERGLLTVAQSADALATAEPGRARLKLVEGGHVSNAQLDNLQSELELRELMETLTDTTTPETVQRALLQPGRRLGRYVLESEIGAGGMGVVWRGWDSQLSRWVAIKQLKVKEPKLVSRFMREASLLARLAHPNITGVHEIGVHEGQPFLVMELVNGGSPEAGLSRKEAAAVVRDAARAVHYAHEQNIVHRDLKPSNLLVSRVGGRVFVTDFGLARLREEGLSLTASGALLGTPSFMAPEQAQGKEADFRTDVYGLGATLYALIEGKPPHTGEIVHEVVKRVAVANPPTLSGDDDLVVVTQKAMERDREDRYATAGELADELDRFIRDEPIHARHINSVERTWRRAKRRPVVASAVAATTLLLLGVATWGGLELSSYYARQAEIANARVDLEGGETVADELRKMRAGDNFDPEWEAAGMRNLGRHADAALLAAPGYAPAEFLKGLVHLWRDEYAPAKARFAAALTDDPNHHDARVYHLVATYSDNDAASPEITQDGDGFRIVAADDSPAKRAVLAEMQADADALPANYALGRLTSAILASARGEFDTSYGELQAHLDEHPYDQRMRGQLLWTMLAIGRYQETIDVAKQMIERNAFPALAFSATAFAHAGMNDLEGAIAAMTESVARKASLDNEHWIAFWDFKRLHFDLALERYDHILEQRPDHFYSLLGRSLALTMVAQRQGSSELSIARYARGSGLLEQGRADAERAVALQPESAYAQFVLAQALGPFDPAAAIAAHERAMALDPSYYGDGHALIASIHAQHGDFEAAIVSLGKALEREPDKASWLNLQARFYLVGGQADKAAGIVQSRTDDAESMLVLAAAKSTQADYAGALVAAQTAASLRADDATTLANLGYYAGLAGDTAKVEDAFARARTLAPDNPRLFADEALAWYMAGAYERALRSAEALLAQGVATASDHQLRSQLHAQLGRYPAALDAIGLAIATDPQSLEYQTEAARLLVAAGRKAEAERRLPLLVSEPPDFAARVQLRLALGECEQAKRALSDATEKPANLSEAVVGQCG